MPRVTVDGTAYSGVNTINVGGKSLVLTQEYSGNKQITANGTNIDVKGLSTVSVEVPASGITPTGTKTVSSNGTYDVTSYASVSVNVPVPSGTKTINTNGTHNVYDYASVSVNVPTGIVPSGTKTISSNGTYDITEYASVSVSVPSSGTDTSDATATANDIVKDATAYVKGEKVVGAVVPYTGSIGWNDRTAQVVSGTKLQLTGPTAGSTGWMFRSGASLFLSTPLSSLGDATAADVAAGKTFTSTAGIKVTGTASSSSGFPIKNGTVTPAADSTSVTISTGLSSISGFAVWSYGGLGSYTVCWFLANPPGGTENTHGYVVYKETVGSKASTFTSSNTYHTRSGGTLTLKQYSSSYPIKGSAPIYWVAW